MMAAAWPLTRYGAFEGARFASGQATRELHHAMGHDRPWSKHAAPTRCVPIICSVTPVQRWPRF